MEQLPVMLVSSEQRNELFATCIAEDPRTDWRHAAIDWLRTAYQQRNAAAGPVDPLQHEHRGRAADRSGVSFAVARCLRSVAGRLGPCSDDGNGKMDRRTTRSGQH